MLDARSVHDVGVEIDKRFAVGKVKWRISVHLTPDEHVFGRERDLLVSVANVGAHRLHDLLFWQVDLRIEIRKTKLTAPAAAGCHLDHAKRRARVGKEYSFAIQRVFDFNLS